MKNKKILVIDDEAYIREIYSELISSELGLETIEASSIENAIRVLSDNRQISAVISDFNTPVDLPPILKNPSKNLNGCDLYNFVSTLNRQLPILYISGSDLSWVKDKNMIDSLEKPVSNTVILERFKKLIS